MTDEAAGGSASPAISLKLSEDQTRTHSRPPKIQKKSCHHDLTASSGSHLGSAFAHRPKLKTGCKGCSFELRYTPASFGLLPSWVKMIAYLDCSLIGFRNLGNI